MKPTTYSFSKLLLFVFLFCAIALYTNAQKLPNKQEISLRAPANIKIDGKVDEWDNKFQAYNNANRVFYTIANDDDNLYIIIKATDLYSISKIGIGGIIFTISNLTDKKLREKAVDNITIQFPVININKSTLFESTIRQYQDLKTDAVTNKKEIEGLIESGNKRIADMFKDIKVTGIKTIDELIPVSNTNSIQAAGGFDKQMNYINEIAIPLKYLNSVITNGQQFSYNIKLKGAPTPEDWLRINKFPPPQAERNDGDVDHDYKYRDAPTDFWGEYTLAKK
ncbi:MAG: hypothetical protein ABI367_03385 [Mucilaginibacter sp.]